MGLTALQESDFGRSLELLLKALDEVSDTIGPWAVGTFLGCFAYIAAIAGDHLRAARLARAASRLIRAQRAPVIPIFEPVLERASEMARQALAPEAFASAEAAGLAMSLDDIIEEARVVEAPAGGAPPWGAQVGVFAALTPAEAQVLRLLTTGRTTREIAEELVVAVSTVDRHLTHIYDKLGVRNRAEAIALALQHHASESTEA
jgi:DNA-binding CsgD family transcriptional regulator